MRRCFFIFDYDHNLAEAQHIIGLGLVKAAVPVAIDGPEDWNAAKVEGVEQVKNLIDQQLSGASVAIVLIGQRTASLGYVQYAIERAIHRHCGLLGIHVHKLANAAADPKDRGAVPFQHEAEGLLEGQHYTVHDWDPDRFIEWVNEAATDWKSLARPKPLDRVPPSLAI